MLKEKLKNGFIGINNYFEVKQFIFLLCCLSGALTGLSAPGYNQWYLAWVGLIPLIVVIGQENSPGKSFLYALGFGFFYELVALAWFAGLHPLHWLGLSTLASILLVTFVLIVLPAYQALFVSLFGILTHYLFKLKYGKTILIALGWVLVVQVLSSLGPFAFPWAMIQYSQYKILPLIQVSEFIGGNGIGFLIVCFNTAAALLIIDLIKYKNDSSGLKFFDSAPHFISLGILILLVGTIVITGFNKISNSIEKGRINATVTQAAIPVEFFRTGKITAREQIVTYINLIRHAPPGLIIFPEGAVPLCLTDPEHSEPLEVIKTAATLKKSTIITGDYGRLKEGETNAVIAISPGCTNKQCLSVYHKRHLVPYGEYTPFREILPEPLEKILSISSTRDFASGKKANVLKTRFATPGVTICYEAIFPHFSRDLVRNGADVLINVSNLGWFHNSIIDQQFLAACVFRAIETDRYVIVSINNGSSAIINPSGEIIVQAPKGKKAFVSAKIIPKDTKTFFTRWGL